MWLWFDSALRFSAWVLEGRDKVTHIAISLLSFRGIDNILGCNFDFTQNLPFMLLLASVHVILNKELVMVSHGGTETQRRNFRLQILDSNIFPLCPCASVREKKIRGFAHTYCIFSWPNRITISISNI